jgi:hypothetical protein
MSTLVKRLRNLPGALALMLEAWLRLGLARYAILYGRGFAALAAPWGAPMYETFRQPLADPHLPRRIARAIERASRVTPWVSNCLPQAITAKQMLQKRGLRSTLYLGLARASAEKVSAHAWLRCGQFFVTGGNGHGFTVVASFAESDERGPTAVSSFPQAQTAVDWLK